MNIAVFVKRSEFHKYDFMGIYYLLELNWNGIGIVADKPSGASLNTFPNIAMHVQKINCRGKLLCVNIESAMWKKNSQAIIIMYRPGKNKHMFFHIVISL